MYGNGTFSSDGGGKGRCTNGTWGGQSESAPMAGWLMIPLLEGFEADLNGLLYGRPGEYNSWE